MAVVAVKRGGSGKLLSGPRAGTTIMAAGLVLAVVAALLVFFVARQARVATTEAVAVAQVYVVMATREVQPNTPIPADAVAVKPFPAAFAPEGVISTVDQVVGRYATTRLTRDQIVLGSQLAAGRQGTNLTETIPPGKVGLWLPLPDLIAQSGTLRAGDRVDILLSLPLAAPGAVAGAGTGNADGDLTTQLTLQSVEVYFVGAAGAPSAPAAQGAGQGAVAGQGASQGSAQGARQVLMLVDPQDAVVAKFIKDSGGTIDFVLRSREWRDAASTQAVNTQTLVDRFGFRR